MATSMSFTALEKSHNCSLLMVLTRIFRSYEALPPNFSLAANMVAGAFAGIAVRTQTALPASTWLMYSRNIQSCIQSTC